MPLSLETLLGDCQELLTDWAGSGAFGLAASEALALRAEPEALTRLVSQWSHGDFSGLPPIVLLPASLMPVAAGAYAISTGTIYLNQDWLAEASAAQAIAVLMEELGHWLDSQIRSTDTPGDEGALLARLLMGPELSPEEESRLRSEEDRILITLASGQMVMAEASADTLAPTIQGLTLGATTLDPSQPGGAYLSAALRFSDHFSGFDYGYISYSSKYSSQSLWLYLSDDKIQGSALAGTAYASRKLEFTAAASRWFLNSIQLSDKAGNFVIKNSYSSDWNTFLSSSGITQTTFDVAYGPNPAPGTGPDSLAPTIQSFSLDSSNLDPFRTGGAYLSAALRFSDNLSGFGYGSISFRSASSGQTRSLSFSRSNLQGSNLAGILYASQKLDSSTAAGNWSLDSIQLGDTAGNSFFKNTYSSDWNTFLSSSGITQTSFQVVYGPNPVPGSGPDSLAPTLQGLSFDSSSLDPSQPGGAYLSVALKLSDNLSGFYSGNISFRSTSTGQTRTLYFYRSTLQGSTLAGSVYASQKLDLSTTAGSWSLDSIWLSDTAGNSVFKNSYSPDWRTFLSSSGIIQTSFQVVYGPNPAPASGSDSLAPTLHGFSLDSSSLDPSQPGGALLSGKLSFKDNASGFNYGSLGFSSDSGQSTGLSFGLDGTDHIISGTQLSGVAFASTQLSTNAAAGTWRLTSIYLRDHNDNELEKTSKDSDWNAFLNASGITQTSFQVAYGPNLPPGTGPDSLPP